MAAAATATHERKRKGGAPSRPDESQSHPNAFAFTGALGAIVVPQKRWYRQRAHANPFADHDLV